MTLVDFSTGSPKYMHLAKLVKCCLTLSHGNADPERGFSINKSLLSKERLSLSQKTIVALRVVKDAVRRAGRTVSCITITSKLLLAVQNSNKLYLEEQRKEKKKKEEHTKKKEENRKREATDIQEKKIIAVEKMNFLEKQVQELQSQVEAAHAVIAERKERLGAAIKHKDLRSASVASIMLEAGSEKLIKTVETIQVKQSVILKLKDKVVSFQQTKRKKT